MLLSQSPSSNILVEQSQYTTSPNKVPSVLMHTLVWCNQSGGSAIGSLSDGTAIEDVLYRFVVCFSQVHIA